MKNYSIDTHDWTYNAGIVGLLRALGINSQEELEYSDCWDYDKQQVVINTDIVQGFTDKYFSQLLNTVDYLSMYQRLVSQYDLLMQEDYSEDKFKDFSDKAERYFSRRGVLSGLQRIDKLNLLDNTIKERKNEDTDIYLSDMGLLLESLDTESGTVVRKIDAINSYLSSFLGSQFPFVKGGKRTQYFEKEYEKSIMKPLYEFLEEDHAGYKYRDSYTGEPMKYYINPTVSKHYISSRSSSSIEGLNYKNKANENWQLSYGSMQSPLSTFMFTLFPLGMTVVGNKAMFLDNSTSGVCGLLTSNNAISYLVKNEQEGKGSRFGKAIREFIKQDLTNKRKGANIIYVDGREGIVEHQSLSSNKEKELSSAYAASTLPYYYKNKAGEWHNVYDDLVKTNNFDLYVRKMIAYYLYNPDSIRFPIDRVVMAVLGMKEGNGLDKKIYHYGYYLAKNYLSASGNSNVLNGLIFKLLRTKSSTETIRLLNQVYAYEHKPFNWELYSNLSNEETYEQTKNAILAGVLSVNTNKDKEANTNEE